MSQQLVVFFDTLGRTILGVRVNENSDVLEVQNPSVLHAGLNEQGKIQVNLIPAFFREFQKDWNLTQVFSYNKSNITLETTGIELEEKLASQYFAMWAQRPDREEIRKAQQARELAPAADVPTPPKLNLFDKVEPAAPEVTA